MATETSRSKPITAEVINSTNPVWAIVRFLLAPLASLKLTVMLLALAIAIVFIGTLAQTEKNIWQVIHDYFRMDLSSPTAAVRTAFAWVEFRMLFPASFFPELRNRIPVGYGFFFPNGWLIGFVMFLNLTAAHLLRFRLHAKGTRLIYGLAVMLLGTLLTALLIVAGSMQTADRIALFIEWPSLRILWLLIQCTVVSLVLLAGFTILFRKRSGIVLIHSGIGLLMLGELVVGVAAVESQMRIVEGQTVNYVEDTRDLELAIIASASADEDDVIAIPQSRLREGQVLQDDVLPFDVELVRFFPNSALQRVTPNDANPATAGTGLQWKPVDQRAGTGTDTSGMVDLPAAYITLIDKASQKPLGTYLVSLMQAYQGLAEKIQVGDATYDLVMRFKRIYKPYSMHLIDVRFDRYMGTQTARSYSSELRLVDRERNVDRNIKIWMNNPLRFSGETFYQSSYNTDPATGAESTGLQVVTNTGWRIPYISCMMVVVGLFAQFGQVFVRFIRRRQNEVGGDRPDVVATAIPSKPAPPPRQSNANSTNSPSSGREAAAASGWLAWIAPLVIVALCGGWLLSKARIPDAADGTMDLVAFGRLPVMYEGRVKPIDTLARNSLRVLSDKQSVVDQEDQKQPAVKWLLDVITDSPDVRKHRVFRIHNLEVLDTLGQKARQGFRYSLNDITGKLDAFEDQVRLAHQNDAVSMSLYQKKIVELDKKLRQYLVLREAFSVPPLRREQLREDINAELSRRSRYEQVAMPLVVPPERTSSQADQDDEEQDHWQPYSYAEFDDRALRDGRPDSQSGHAGPAFDLHRLCRR